MRSEAFEQPPDPGPLRVLLVDDDEDAYVLTRMHLSKIQGERIKLDWAASFDEGLNQIRKGEHAVYLLDYRLGARTGLDLLQQALAIGCKQPMIILTSENPQVDAEAMRLGAADFLNKDRLDSALLERSIRYSIKQFATVQALQESEARLASFMQNVPCAVSMKDSDGRYVYVNQTCARVFHRKLEDWIGKTDADLRPKANPQKLRLLEEKILRENRPIETTEAVQGKDGVRFWLTTRFPIPDSQSHPNMIGAAALDITELKRLEREIQQISEQEKQRIGQDLHDGLGQYLTGIACMVKALGEKLSAKNLPEAADARKITTMVNETIRQARDLARGLCPVELETNGLQAALQELAATVENVFRVKCPFQSPTSVSVYDNAAAIHLYRIAQEAISNAIKHGHATEVEVALSAQNGQIVLTVRDNGDGLPAEFDKSSGLGLRVMNHRAGILGATVSVESMPGRGTAVTCAVPNKLEKPATKL